MVLFGQTKNQQSVIGEETEMSEVKFFETPLTRFAGTIADITGVQAPEFAPAERVEEIKTLVSERTGKPTVDRAVIYNPDALGAWFIDKYTEMFKPMTDRSMLRVDYLTSFPPKTPVCFGTMFTGATPDQHGIHAYVKPHLKIDSLFDRWAAADKKVAMVSVAGQSIPLLFQGRNIDYFLFKSDGAVIEKSVELIHSDEYDIIEVYVMEYDTVMHMTHPKSIFAKAAARRHVEGYVKLYEAVSEAYKGQSTFLAFAPDHGVHREKYLLGNHGKNIPEDMNLSHFYTVI